MTRDNTFLEDTKMGLFEVDAYNTDYVLTKEEDFKKAIQTLRNSGYQTRGEHQ